MRTTAIQPLLASLDGRSQAVRERLAQVIRFQRVAPKRMIVRQGHQLMSVYLLVRGEVVVLKTSIDSNKGIVTVTVLIVKVLVLLSMLVNFEGQAVSSIVGIEKDGYDFGKSVEGHYSKRQHTVISKGICDTNVLFLSLML